MDSGIYAVTNTINGKKYIGQSQQLRVRKNQHFSVRNEANTELKQEMMEFGIEHFTFEVLEYCEKENLSEREVFWIAKMKPEYNRTAGGIGSKGMRHSQETKEKLRAYGKAQWEARTVEEKKEFAKNNLKGPRVGHPVSAETRQKLREANLGKSPTPEARARASASIKSSEKYQASRKALRKPIICVETGEILESVTAATKKYGTTIGPHLRGEYKTCKGLHFKYYECRD